MHAGHTAHLSIFCFLHSLDLRHMQTVISTQTPPANRNNTTTTMVIIVLLVGITAVLLVGVVTVQHRTAILKFMFSNVGVYIYTYRHFKHVQSHKCT